MKRVRLIAGILSIMLIASLCNLKVSRAENVNTENQIEDGVINTTSLEKESDDIVSVLPKKEKASGNHTADTALYLDSSYIGQVLMDGAAAEENWYYFKADANRKITVLLEQPADGDYDIILYKLDEDTGNLSPVASSGYVGNIIDRLSAVNTSEGYYFLRVIPETVPTDENAVYYFVVNMVDKYDSSEPNDNPSQSKVYTGTNITLKGTIDNVFDQDWTKITTKSEKSYQIQLSGVPSGAEYAVNVYDENLNIKAALVSEGSKKSYISLKAGTYYICIGTYNNYFSDSATYSFNMNEVHSLNSTFYTTNGGHQVEITDRAVYVDGALVDLNWRFEYNILYTRTQDFKMTSSTSVEARSYQNGTFVDGQNMNRSSDCIRVMVNNFTMSYFCTSPYASWTKNFGSSDWTYFYIDANTGKTIGTDANYYHTNMGITNSFKKF